jgi:GDP-L-fucose synthase
MKNVIVTGATGFIGRALTCELRKRFAPDIAILEIGSETVDLVNRAATFDWFERRHWTFECDHIFHLAALYKAGDWPVHHPATQFHVNLLINAHLLEAWKRFFPKARLTSVVSYCMYPSHEAPHPESELWGTEPEEYLFSYAMTKKALLIGQRAYRQEFGLDSTSVVLPTVYGPNDSFAENSHVVGALIGKFVRAAASGAPTVEVWGDGSQEREFLFVEDAVDGILAAAQRSAVDVLNLGMGAAASIRAIADLIADAAGFTGEIRYNPTRFVGVKKRLLDVTRIRTELGWSAPHSLEAGIRKTVRWYQERLGVQRASASAS